MKDIKQEILSICEKVGEIYPLDGDGLFEFIDKLSPFLEKIFIAYAQDILEANNAQWKKEANKIFDMYDSYLRELGLEKSDMVEGMKKRFNASNQI